jgi:putative transposase
VPRVWALDEARFGLKVWYRRRWCPIGTRPPWLYNDQYEWLWLYAAVEPTTGQSFCLFLPRLDSAGFELLLREWRQACPAGTWAVVLDNSGAHTSGHVRWPEGLAPVYLPPYSPELNPGERWFKELREPLSNQIHDHLDTLEASRTQALRPYWEHPLALVQLTAYPWWRRGVEFITTSSP